MSSVHMQDLWTVKVLAGTRGHAAECASDFISTSFHDDFLADMILSHMVKDFCIIGPRVSCPVYSHDGLWSHVVWLTVQVDDWCMFDANWLSVSCCIAQSHTEVQWKFALVILCALIQWLNYCRGTAWRAVSGNLVNFCKIVRKSQSEWLAVGEWPWS